MGVTAAELLQIQADLVAAACDKTCVIQRGTPGKDIYGNATISNYQTHTTTVAGMAQPSASMLQNYDYRIGSLAAFLVHLPVGTDVAAGDRLVVDSQTLEVHVMLTPQSYQGLLQVIAAEVK